MLVVWQHSSEIFNHLPAVAANGTFLADVAWSLDFGRIGVVCFFLISGFVIPYSFSAGDGALKKFVIRRFFRLYPVYWISVILAATATYLFWGTVFEPGALLANFTMLQKFFDEPHIQGLYWTLQAEVIFYVICAGMFATGILHKKAFQIGACVLSLGLFLVISVLKSKTSLINDLDKELAYIPYVIAIMFSGTILRSWLFEEKSKLTDHFSLLAPLLVFGLPIGVLLLYFLGANVSEAPTRFFFGHVLGVALFFIGYYTFNVKSSALLWLGAVSYSVYLFHPIVMNFVYWSVLQEWASSFAALHMSVYIGVIAALTFLVSLMFYKLVEQPSISIGRRLSQ